MERHAIMFTVKPGSEDEVARILSSYDRPPAEIDEDTRLLATTVFMKDNVVVRIFDIEGALDKVMRHLSQMPQIREAEEALNPYLEEPRDLSDQEGARRFFGRAMMQRLTHRSAADNSA